jgi:FkbM family methyltransferase
MDEMYDYLQTLDSPKRVLDLGAWNGRWTNAVKKFWPDAHYTCIEAGQKHEDSLRECANKFYIAVLGNENKKTEVQLKSTGYSKGSNIFGATQTFKPTKTEQREMQTLESVVGADATYDFIKQDVQGAELLVMQGSPEIFKRAKYILNEVNLYKDPKHPLIPDVKEMDQFMHDLGFIESAVIEEHGKNNQVDKLYWNK